MDTTLQFNWNYGSALLVNDDVIRVDVSQLSMGEEEWTITLWLRDGSIIKSSDFNLDDAKAFAKRIRNFANI